MTRIEIRWNDASRARGIFSEPDRAAVFLASSLTSRPSFNKNVKILIDGIEFDPPLSKAEQWRHKGRSYDEYKIDDCLRHIEYCIEVREAFYD